MRELLLLVSNTLCAIASRELFTTPVGGGALEAIRAEDREESTGPTQFPLRGPDGPCGATRGRGS